MADRRRPREEDEDRDERSGVGGPVESSAAAGGGGGGWPAEKRRATAAAATAEKDPPHWTAPAVVSEFPPAELGLRKMLVRERPAVVDWARDVIRLSWVSTKEELDAALASSPPERLAAAEDESDNRTAGSGRGGWRPLYTHQLFGEEEKVVGYKGLDVHVVYSDPTLHCLVRASHEVALPERLADNLPKRMKPALSPSTTEDAEVFAARLAPSRHPADHPEAFGEEVGRYERRGRTFAIRRWRFDEPGTRVFHRRLETLAMWTIETASSIDLDDPAWETLGLFDVTDRPRLAGYLTLFRFRNPFRRERPEAVRVAQVVVLPTFQRQGHGTELLRAVHRIADTEDLFEVTAESPGEGYQRMRDTVDLERALEHRVFAALAPATQARWEAVHTATAIATATASASRGSEGRIDGTGPDAPGSVGDGDAGRTVIDRAHRLLRTPVRQCARVLEMLLLAEAGEDAERVRAVRLRVKRRLFASDADVRNMPNGPARHAVLESFFREEELAAVQALAAAGLVARERVEAATRARDDARKAAEAQVASGTAAANPRRLARADDAKEEGDEDEEEEEDEDE